MKSEKEIRKVRKEVYDQSLKIFGRPLYDMTRRTLKVLDWVLEDDE